ncbi:MAG: hypothetical protein ACLP9K_04940 [Nitrososphaerales archaeon]
MQESVGHLRYLDDFFTAHNKEYEHMRKKMLAIPGYGEFLDYLYFGQDGRQMILADVLEYMVTGRFLYKGYHEPKAFLKILFYLVNQLMIQENSILNPKMRKKLLVYMEKEGGKNLIHFSTGENEEWDARYEKAKTAPNEDVKGWRKPLYRVIDSLMPKSAGTATELLVLAYLLDMKLGYILPLLNLQRMKGRTGRIIAPPDFLMIRNSRFYGFEVGAGQGGIGKVDQGNAFSAATGVPVITLKVNPPSNNVSFRCPACNEWILYCDPLINSYARKGIIETNDKLGSIDKACKDFPNCKSAMFIGDIGNGTLHYHYTCVRSQEKVKRALKNERITHMSLQIEGFEGFS